MQSYKQSSTKILVIRNNHIETIVPELLMKYLLALAKKYKISFLDEFNKSALEDEITKTTIVCSKNSTEFQNKINQLLKDKVIRH